MKPWGDWLPYVALIVGGALGYAYLVLVLWEGGDWFRYWQQYRRNPKDSESHDRRERIEGGFWEAFFDGARLWCLWGCVFFLLAIPQWPFWPSLRGALGFGAGGAVLIDVAAVFSHAKLRALDPVPIRGWYFVIGPAPLCLLLTLSKNLWRTLWFVLVVEPRERRASRARRRTATSSSKGGKRRVFAIHWRDVSESVPVALVRKRLPSLLRQHFVAERVEVTPRVLNEVYAMLKADPLAYVRARRHRETAGAVVLFAIGLIGMLAARYWLLRHPQKVEFGSSMWWVLTVLTFVGVVVVFNIATEGIREAKQELAEEEERLGAAATDAYAGRESLRIKTRQFAERMEDEYGWMLEMDENHQKQRALQWDEKIIDAWHRENVEWGELRGPDTRDLVIEDLDRDQKGLGSRMLRIWECRRKLYQYAIAYATPEDRAAEAARLREADLQAQARAKARERAFGKTLNEDASPDGDEWDRI